MKEHIEQRVLEVAEYMLDNKSTVRQAAKEFKVSKSTIHKDMTERLPEISGKLSNKVLKVIAKNKSERSVRGGHALQTKLKELNKDKPKKAKEKKKCSKKTKKSTS